jgi:hypothetical protein
MFACHSFYKHSVQTAFKHNTNPYQTEAQYKNDTELTQYTATVLCLCDRASLE